MGKRKSERNNNGNIHPRRIFKTPDELFKAWKEYVNTLEEERLKWPKVQYVGKDGNRVEDYPVLPFTMEGFEVYCYDNYGKVKQYFENKDGYYEDFVDICTRIKTEIRKQQITGGMVGAYNASITARLNGLTDKVEQSGTIVNKIQNETDEELLERLNKAKKIIGDAT